MLVVLRLFWGASFAMAGQSEKLALEDLTRAVDVAAHVAEPLDYDTLQIICAGPDCAFDYVALPDYSEVAAREDADVKHFLVGASLTELTRLFDEPLDGEPGSSMEHTEWIVCFALEPSDDETAPPAETVVRIGEFLTAYDPESLSAAELRAAATTCRLWRVSAKDRDAARRVAHVILLWRRACRGS